MNLTIGIPTQWGLWRAQMGLSLCRAIVSTPGEITLSPQNGPYLALNREASMRDAIIAKSDYLIFVDTDMVFPADAFTRLIAHGKDVIGANYYEKRLPLVTNVKPIGPNGEMADDGKLGTMTMPHEPFQCAGLGAGLLAIRVARVQECMAPPYFAFADHRGEMMGEDLAFCGRARRAGLQVWCDPTIPVLHVGDYLYGQTD